MIDPWACLLGALLLLILPLHWLAAAVLAAGVHELCHLGAVYALGGRVLSFCIGPAGARMETDLQGRGRALLAALAGPAGSLLLLFLGRFLPHVAVCAAIQGLFNLLPLYPLDGGRVLRCCLEGRLSDRTMAVTEGALALAAAALLAHWSVIFAAAVLIRGFLGKILANRVKSGYNRADNLH